MMNMYGLRELKEAVDLNRSPISQRIFNELHVVQSYTSI